MKRYFLPIFILIVIFFVELDYDSGLLIGKNMTRELAVKALEAGHQRLKELTAFDAESMEASFRPLAEALGAASIKFNVIQPTARGSQL